MHKEVTGCIEMNPDQCRDEGKHDSKVALVCEAKQPACLDGIAKSRLLQRIDDCYGHKGPDKEIVERQTPVLLVDSNHRALRRYDHSSRRFCRFVEEHFLYAQKMREVVYQHQRCAPPC